MQSRNASSWQYSRGLSGWLLTLRIRKRMHRIKAIIPRKAADMVRSLSALSESRRSLNVFYWSFSWKISWMNCFSTPTNALESRLNFATNLALIYSNTRPANCYSPPAVSSYADDRGVSSQDGNYYAATEKVWNGKSSRMGFLLLLLWVKNKNTSCRWCKQWGFHLIQDTQANTKCKVRVPGHS